MADSYTDLAGRTIVITGGAGGIGSETARAACAAKMKVALVEINQELLDKTVKEIERTGGEVYGFPCDLTDETQIVATFAAIEKKLGQIDVLVNNAMFHDPVELLESTLENWERTIAVNLTAPFLTIRCVLPAMMNRGAGNIINIGTVNAKMMIGSDSYSASKGGLHALTRTVAVRYGPQGIRCNTIVPGTIATDGWLPKNDRNLKLYEDLISWYPLARVGKPADVANAVLFLASDQSQWMSGTEFVVDGGLLAGYAPMYPTIEGLH
jgi:NAD(P)-dependent dehydrogenase (short-subunit alcohol dehydrogenase family)